LGPRGLLDGADGLGELRRQDVNLLDYRRHDQQLAGLDHQCLGDPDVEMGLPARFAREGVENTESRLTPFIRAANNPPIQALRPGWTRRT